MSELKAINAYQLTTNTEDSDVYIHNDEFGCGGDLVECYLKSKADKVIAEKDAEIAELRMKRCDQCQQEIYKRDKEIAELKAKNERLKATPEEIMKEVFDKMLIYPHDMVRLEDAYRLAVSLRKTKRALYKACANWAYWVDHVLTIKFLHNNSYTTKLERDRWYNMEHRCLKKMEKYK